MRMNDRIRIYGARLNRLIYRFFIFIGMLALFSLALGGAADDFGRLVYGVILVIALSVGIVILWFRSKPQRDIDRSQQLAAEVSLSIPDAPVEEQNHEYTLRHRREMRMESLWYLGFAALAGIWFWGMYAVEAASASWTIGFLGIVPGLLLIALARLVFSVLPVKHDEQMPSVSRQNWELTKSIQEKKDIISGYEGGKTVYNLFMADKHYSTPQDYLRDERNSELGGLLLMLFGAFFFCLLPLALLGLDIYAVNKGVAPGWSLLMFSAIALLCVPLWLYITHVPAGTGSATGALIDYIRSRREKRVALFDSIQSYQWKDNAVKIVLSQNGTVIYRCGNKTYDEFFSEPRSEVIVVKVGSTISRIILLPNDGIAALSQENARIGTDNDILLSDEALHQAVQREIQYMTPVKRDEIEAGINELLDQIDYMKEKGYSNLSTLEQGNMHSASATDMHKSNADIELNAIESYVIEKLDVSKQSIMRMKKNPFAPALVKRLLLAATVGIVGIVGTALIEKRSGTNLGYVYLTISAITGALALSCGESFVNMRRFRKLQKAYKDPSYRKKVLDAAVYREIKEQVKQRRQQAGSM